MALSLAAPWHSVQAQANAPNTATKSSAKKAVKAAPSPSPKTASKATTKATGKTASKTTAKTTPKVAVSNAAASAKPARPVRVATVAGSAAASAAVGALVASKVSARDADAENRLIAIYRLIGEARNREALDKGRELVRDYPTFQLAQLVYGDLLNSQVRAVRAVGDVSPHAAKAGAEVLAAVRPLRSLPNGCVCPRSEYVRFLLV